MSDHPILQWLTLDLLAGLSMKGSESARSAFASDAGELAPCAER